MAVVLALDLATRVGFAFDGGAGAPITGSRTLRGGAGALGAMGKDCSAWLAEMIETIKPDILAFEAPLMGGRGVVFNAATARLLIGLAFLAETIAEAYELRCYEAHVQSVRKYFLGTARSKNAKKETVARCRMLGWDVATHDAADAAALWAFAKANLDRSFRLDQATPLFGARRGKEAAE